MNYPGYQKGIFCTDVCFIYAIPVLWMPPNLSICSQAASECVSVTIHPGGWVVAAGTIDGHLVVVRATNGKHVATVRVCASPLSALSYHKSQ